MKVPSWTCKWFVKNLRMNCERLAKPQLKKSNFTSPCFNLRNFLKSLLTCENSPYVNLGYFLADSVRFLFQDILCNYPFSPCNQLKIFLDIVISWRYFVFRFFKIFLVRGCKYLSIYVLEYLHLNISNSRKKFLGITCTFFLVSKNTELCSALPFHFVFYFLSSQTPSEDIFSEDEWLDFFISWTKGS